MKNSIEQTIKRIKRFGLTCTLNDNGYLRHFHNGYEYVEIGGIKWATCNVGAEKPTDSGLYFQWGDTQGYTAEQVENGEKRFGWGDYKYSTRDNLTKYNNTDNNTVLEPQDDAATFNMGDGWRMPTEAEFRILQHSTTSKWVTNYQGSGVRGLLCTSKTDSSKTLFFLASGYCNNGSVYSVGSYGTCWSSSLDTYYLEYSFLLGFYDGDVCWGNILNRYYGLVLRGVVG